MRLFLLFSILLYAPLIAAQTGWIRGTVGNYEDSTMSGTAVNLWAGNTWYGGMPLDSAGKFTFGGLPPGQYDVHVSKSGYVEIVQTGVFVSKDKWTILDGLLLVPVQPSTEKPKRKTKGGRKAGGQ